MGCLRCGVCCKQTFFVLRDVPVEQDEREIAKWAMYHGVKVMRYGIDGVDYLAVSLPGVCRYLIEKDGEFSCAIYRQRPKVCQDYFCDRAKSS